MRERKRDKLAENKIAVFSEKEEKEKRPEIFERQKEKLMKTFR